MSNINNSIDTKKKISKGIVQRFAVILIIIAFLLVTSVLYFIQSKTNTISNIKKTAEERTTIVNDVTSLVGELPENPTLYKLDNVDQLKAQLPFFKGAENTDFLLVFPTSKQILLYSPTQKKVLNIGSTETDLNPKKDAVSQLPVDTATTVTEVKSETK